MFRNMLSDVRGDGGMAMDISGSPHLTAAREAERPTRWWIAIPLVVALFIAVGGAVIELIGAAFGTPEEGSAAELVAEVPEFGIALVVLLLWVRLRDRRPALSIGFQWRSTPLMHLVGGIAGGVLLVSAPALLLRISGAYDSVPAGDDVTVGAGALLIVIPLVLAVLVQASTEEAMFRGYVQQLTGTQLAGWAAVLAPSIGFAAAHLDFHPLVMANIILVAILFSFLALRIGTIWLVCGIHCGWNWAQGNLFGIPVSGNPVDVSILRFAPDASGADWLTGGEFGIEGSAVTTVVLALAAFAAYRWFTAGARTTTAEELAAA